MDGYGNKWGVSDGAMSRAWTDELAKYHMVNSRGLNERLHQDSDRDALAILVACAEQVHQRLKTAGYRQSDCEYAARFCIWSANAHIVASQTMALSGDFRREGMLA